MIFCYPYLSAILYVNIQHFCIFFQCIQYREEFFHGHWVFYCTVDHIAHPTNIIEMLPKKHCTHSRNNWNCTGGLQSYNLTITVLPPWVKPRKTYPRMLLLHNFQSTIFFNKNVINTQLSLNSEHSDNVCPLIGVISRRSNSRVRLTADWRCVIQTDLPAINH